jgi:hypothetical protein
VVRGDGGITARIIGPGQVQIGGPIRRVNDEI